MKILFGFPVRLFVRKFNKLRAPLTKLSKLRLGSLAKTGTEPEEEAMLTIIESGKLASNFYHGIKSTTIHLIE